MVKKYDSGQLCRWFFYDIIPKVVKSQRRITAIPSFSSRMEKHLAEDFTVFDFPQERFRSTRITNPLKPTNQETQQHNNMQVVTQEFISRVGFINMTDTNKSYQNRKTSQFRNITLPFPIKNLIKEKILVLRKTDEGINLWIS